MYFKALVFGFSFLSLSLVSLVIAASIFAGTQCCDSVDGSQCGRASANHCGGCSDTNEAKNDAACYGGNTQCTDADARAGKCHICGPGQVANACSTSTSNSSLCRYTTNVPSKVSLKINQQQVVASNTFATAYIGGMYASSSKPSIATVAPSFTNLCCGWSYNYNANPVKTTITALNAGTTTVKITFIARDSADKNVCTANVPVTVNGIAEPLVCLPGAKCVGDRVTGGKLTCSMPVITDATQLATYGTPKYYLKCTPYKGSVAGTVISKGSNTGTFPAFGIATGVTNIKCSFRYCQVDKNGLTNCSNWGQGA